jgi:hypothetical protein
MSSCTYFSCLFTKHKSQKRKIWQDGKLKVSPSGSISIYEIGSNIISGNDAPPVDTMCIHTSQIGTIKPGSELESEKFLITVEGEWRQQQSMATTSTPNITNANVVVNNNNSMKAKNGRDGMKKLMVHKFRKPTKFIPGQNSRNNHPLIVRKAPLQPGEYIQQFQDQSSNNNTMTHVQMNGGFQSYPSYNSRNVPMSHHVHRQEQYPQEHIRDESNVPSHPSNVQNSRTNTTSSIPPTHYSNGTHQAFKQALSSMKLTKKCDNPFISNEFNPSSYYDESDEEEEDDDETSKKDLNMNCENFDFEKNHSESTILYHANLSKRDHDECDQNYLSKDDFNNNTGDSLSKSELIELFSHQNDEFTSQRQDCTVVQMVDVEDEPPNPFLKGLLQRDEAMTASVTRSITSNTIWNTDNDNNPWNTDEVLDDDDFQDFHEENAKDIHQNSGELKSTENQDEAEDKKKNNEDEENITFSITMEESSSDDDSDDGSAK